MKKILTASLVAMMAVSAAHADIASTTYVDNKVSDHADNVASATELGHVKIGKGINVTEEGVISVSAGGVIGEKEITTDMIADDAVTSEKIKDGEVKTDDIADLAVTTVKIADNAVTMGKLGDDVTTAMAGHELAANKLTGETVASPDLTATKYMSAFTTDKYIDKKLGVFSEGNAAELAEMKGDIAANAENIGSMEYDPDSQKIKEFSNTTYLKDSESLSDAVVALDTAAAAAQVKSTADFQVGGTNGTWFNLADTLPDVCKQGTGAECALVSADGVIKWSVVVDGDLSSNDIAVKSVAESTRPGYVAPQS